MLLLFNALFCLAGGWCVGAVPVRLTQPTSEGEPAYVPSPKGRGTIDILLSSIITLTLCVYTSIHLNITPKRKIFGIPSVWVYKFYWILIAVFAPEFVLYAAYIQWRNAQILCKQLKELDGLVEPTLAQKLGSVLKSWIAKLRCGKATAQQTTYEHHKLTSKNPETNQPNSKQLETAPKAEKSRQSNSEIQLVEQDESKGSHSGRPAPRWRDVTMVSAFYIVMGGFAYDIRDLSDHHRYIALTPEGFMAFAKAELITPDCLNNDDIADRSKADSLGKLLVCLQALWLVVNCIARKASGKPTTLVELNVIVHVVVAVVVYGLWWHKPLAVATPTFLQRTYAAEHPSEISAGHDRKMVEPGFLAILVLSSQYYIKISTQEDWESETATVIGQLKPHPAEANHKYFEVAFEPYIPENSKFEIRLGPSYRENTATKCTISPAADRKIKAPSFILLHRQCIEIKEHRCVAGLRGGQQRAIVVTSKVLATLELACAYIRKMKENKGQSIALDSILSNPKRITTADPPNYSVKGSIYFGGLHDASDLDNWAKAVIVTILSCFYAGSHASAWLSHFPTYIERWIWRGSCIAIAATPPVSWTLLQFFLRLSDKLDHEDVIPVTAICVTVFLALAIYLLARLFIPVEAFISMRSLPIGAFETVDWTEFWPHV
jgi:hypothetical protein